MGTVAQSTGIPFVGDQVVEAWVNDLGAVGKSDFRRCWGSCTVALLCGYAEEILDYRGEEDGAETHFVCTWYRVPVAEEW